MVKLWLMRFLTLLLLSFCLCSCVMQKPLEFFATSGPTAGSSFTGTAFSNRTIQVNGPNGETFRGKWSASVTRVGNKGAAFLHGDRGGHMDMTIEGGGDGQGFGTATDSAGNTYRLLY